MLSLKYKLYAALFIVLDILSCVLCYVTERYFAMVLLICAFIVLILTLNAKNIDSNIDL